YVTTILYKPTGDITE
ncbi:Pc20g11930, partial [Penicillium rubens Wisconsin 54-1255]